MANDQGTLFTSGPQLVPEEPAHAPAGKRAHAASPASPADQDARKKAIDTSTSILVQAPAGAGKTGLLTQRFLALLAEVDEPEQILAITFTRAAAAEMKHRIVEALENAASGREVPENRRVSHALALRAMQHARDLGWQLLEQPHRLDVQTIDSVCLRFAHSQPLLARLGGALQPADNAAAFYTTAARRTLSLLGQEHNAELRDALRVLMLRRDNNLADCERLVSGMLAKRDAWINVLRLTTGESVDWEEVRATLEMPFVAENARVLHNLHWAMSSMRVEAQLLLAAARYASANHEPTPARDLRPLRDIEHLPGNAPHHLEQWRALSSLLLTGEQWRKQWNKNDGFPAPGKDPGKERREREKRNMEECSAALQQHASGGSQLLQLLCQLHSLPELRYSEDQWRTLQAVFVVLRRAVAELRLVFAEANAVDFSEIAQAAEQVLRDEASMRGLLASEQKRHLLIDEFQDTSRAQYRLIAELLREWQPRDGRTAFLVGDPLQSIYGFRQAEVALFHETRKRGLPCGEGRRHHCEHLQLTHNYRSHRALVAELNQRFEQVFERSREDEFVAAESAEKPQPEPSFQFHAFFAERDDRSACQQARVEEARAVARILQLEQRRIEAAELRGDEEYKVAVLVHSRSHLAAILPRLREAGIPFRAVDLESLAEQQEVADVLMLLRALLHSGERAAWLSVLRAPWCGLLLHDLHLLVGADDRELLRTPVAPLIASRMSLLSADGQRRLARTWAVLEEATRTRYNDANSLSLAGWLERTWMALGGPDTVDATERDNVEAFFRLLDTLAPSGAEVLRADFGDRINRLCAAPDTRVSERFGVQLMTIHKSKGLGFEVVLVPGLDRKTRAESTELLATLERLKDADTIEDELLVAPVGNREDGQPDPTYAWVNAQKRRREAEERKRLFYVACTRARTRLHLLASIATSKGEVRKPADGSLLHAAWSGLEADVDEQWQARSTSPAGLSLAASAELPLGQAVATEPPALSPSLLRLDDDWSAEVHSHDITPAAQQPTAPSKLFSRAEGTLAARARGNALHALLELLARDRARDAAQATNQEKLRSVAARVLREGAFPPGEIREAAIALAEQAMRVARDPIGSWLLAPHASAQIEQSWQVLGQDGVVRTLRVDRSFLAGPGPEEPGTHCLWIIDYKSGMQLLRLQNAADREAWLAEQKTQYAPQLEAYGSALASSAEAERLCYGIYFPEALHLLHWGGRVTV